MTPIEMMNLPQWVCWRMEPDPKGGKARKIPYNPKDGRHKASSTNPATWGTMAEAEAMRDRFGFSGIGFVFTDGCGIIGVDIDYCIRKDGSLNDVAKEITERYPTYTEISPSGEGLHLFYHGTEMPGSETKNSDKGVEMYMTARYFTMTGKQFPGSPDEIRDGSEALPWIHATYLFKPKKEKKTKAGNKRSVPLSDSLLLEKAKASEKGEDFAALFDGQWEGRFPSQSEADMALCCSLAFWSGKNHDQIDRLFRQSKLFRPKWDEVHDAAGATYGEKTIAAALEKTDNTYFPGSPVCIFEDKGVYWRARGEESVQITNFIVEPGEQRQSPEFGLQVICDMVNDKGIRCHMNFMATEFSSAPKFRTMLNKASMGLSYTGTDGDLEMLKTYLDGYNWIRRTAIMAGGFYEQDGHWFFVDQDGAYGAGWEPVDGIIQRTDKSAIVSRLTAVEPITAENMRNIGPLLLRYNVPAKTVTVLGWTAGCFIKELLRAANHKYPHLFMIGEAGSGKSMTLEHVIRHILGIRKIMSAAGYTTFTIMKESASNNTFPQMIDEYKPSKWKDSQRDLMSNHIRSTYDQQNGVRGRPDQTQVEYELVAPIVMAGEESTNETAAKDRSLEINFAKKDLETPGARDAFRGICEEEEQLQRFGRLLLETVLTLNTQTVKRWYAETEAAFDPAISDRTKDGLACAGAGLRFIDAALHRIGLTWAQVFPIPLDECMKWLEAAAKEYLFEDGRTSNQSLVEQSLEIISRMGLSDDECRYLDENTVALHIPGFYDRFTKYIRDHNIKFDNLQMKDFMKHLKMSKMFIEQKQVRLENGRGENQRCFILSIPEIQKHCMVDGFMPHGTSL